jgi:hypothetical protein
MRNRIGFAGCLLITVIAFGWLVGCAQLKPGADPLVVRAEQTESAAKSTFDLILTIDHTDRGFWKTNAAGFHAFCEYLREPQVINVTNVLPRASAMIMSLNNVKRDYMISRTYSNALFSVIASLESVNAQAGVWANLITNQIAK